MSSCCEFSLDESASCSVSVDVLSTKKISNTFTMTTRSRFVMIVKWSHITVIAYTHLALLAEAKSQCDAIKKAEVEVCVVECKRNTSKCIKRSA